MPRGSRRTRVFAWVTLLSTLFAASAVAQFPKGPKKPPYSKPGYWKKKDRPSGGGSGSDAGIPANLTGSFDLGQKVRSTLPAKGSTLDLEFYAIKGAVVDLQINIVGEIGDSKMTLKKVGSFFGEELKRSGKKFAVRDYVVEKSGKLRLTFQHAGEGELELSLTSSAELPKVLEETLDFSDSEAAIVHVDGGLGRKVTEVSLRPTESDGFATLWLGVAGPDRKEFVRTAATELSAARTKLPLDRSVPLSEPDEYYFQFYVDEDSAAAFEWNVKITFNNGPLASGTVNIDPK